MVLVRGDSTRNEDFCVHVRVKIVCAADSTVALLSVMLTDC